MSKGHRSKYKRLRNESKDSRPRAVLKNIRISDTKARIVLNQIKGKVTTHALAMLNYSTRYASRVIAKLLKSEGYVEDYAVVEKEGSVFKTLKITLKYDEKSKPVISNLKRVSRPGLRNYCKAKDIPQVLDGMGIAIISTSKGLLTDRKAKKENVGGEILCYVW